MKALSAIALVATLVLTSAAYAQDADSTADGTTNSAAPTSNSAPNAAPSQSATGNINPSPGSSAANLDAILRTAKPSPFKFDLYSRTGIKQSTLEKNTGDVGTFNYVQGAYALSESKSVRVRQEFTYNLPKANTEGKATVLDTFVGYVDTKLAKLPADVNVSGIVRAYLPTGESTRFVTKQQGGLLGWLIADRSFGKTDVAVGAYGIAYANSQDSYQNASGAAEANTSFNAFPYAEATYNFTERFNVGQTVAADTYWKKSVAGLGAGSEIEESLYLETLASYKIHERFKVGASLLNVVNVWNNPAPFRVFRAEDTTYRVILHANL